MLNLFLQVPTLCSLSSFFFIPTLLKPLKQGVRAPINANNAISVLAEQVTAPIPIPTFGIGFGSRYRYRISVGH